MKLDIFHRWKPVAKWGQHVLQTKTEKVRNIYVTHIRDKASGIVVTKGHGPTEDKSQQYAGENLRALGIEGVTRAIESGQTQQPRRDLSMNNNPNGQSNDISWYDGMTNSARMHKRLGEGEDIEWDNDVDPDIREWFTRNGRNAKA